MNQICRKPNKNIPFCEEWFGAGLNGFWGLYNPVHLAGLPTIGVQKTSHETVASNFFHFNGIFREFLF